MIASDLFKPRKLAKACFLANRRMENMRKARMRFLMQYVGRFYGHLKDGTNEDRKATPINLMYEAMTTYVPNLVFNNPRCKARTGNLLYREYADKLQLATDETLRKIKLKDTLRKAITDSLMFAGIIKTGIADSGQCIYFQEEPLKIGKPYADRVDPDDFIVDPMARDWQEKMFVGNRYRVPKTALLELGIEQAKVDQFQSRYDTDQKGTDAASVSDAKDTPNQYREVTEFADLIDVYLPDQGILVTLPWTSDGSADEFLHVVEYDGPEHGPYHMLGYSWAGDNLMPVPPAGIWYDLAVLTNRAARKMARQSERAKKVLAYEGTAADDVANIRDADDGESVRVDNIDAIKEVEFGGAPDKGFEYINWLRQWFNEMAGNMDMLAGNHSDADTATQAQMLASNQAVRLADSQQTVYQFTAEVCTDIAYFLHTDPLIQLPLIKRMNGQDQQVMYTPDDRMGEWFDYNIEIEPYSMARQDPKEKVRRTMEFATNIVPAAAQAYQILGPAFKINEFLVKMGREIGLEDLDEIIDVPMLQQAVMQSLQTVPPPQKVQQSISQMQPNQPNPAQMGPAGGSQQGDMNQQAQQGAAPAQSQLANRQVGAVGA